VVVVLLAAVAGVGVWLWRWDHGLAIFATGGNEVGGPIPVDHTVYVLAVNGNPLVGALDRRGVTVDMTSVRPHVQVNTAAATIHVLTCAENGRIIALGAVRRPSYCHSPVPFEPGPLHISASLHSSAILLAITAHRRGRIHIEGLDIAYRLGARSGQQNTGLRMSFRATNHRH
jgi:hypothetical protein